VAHHRLHRDEIEFADSEAAECVAEIVKAADPQSGSSLRSYEALADRRAVKRPSVGSDKDEIGSPNEAASLSKLPQTSTAWLASGDNFAYSETAQIC
jgi:hypothetical protein